MTELQMANEYAESMERIRIWVEEHCDYAHRDAHMRWWHQQFQSEDELRNLLARGASAEFVAMAMYGARVIGPLRAGDEVLIADIRAMLPAHILTASLNASRRWFESQQTGPQTRAWLNLLYGGASERLTVPLLERIKRSSRGNGKRKF